MDVGRCLLPSCSTSRSLKTFKIQAVKKLIECAVERGDAETCDKLRTILDSQGEQTSIELHKSCYCSYTSKEHVKKFVMKRKAKSGSSDEPPTARIRRSQMEEFDFKKQCLFCAKTCDPVNPKHPDRWERVVQCERKGIKGALPFKQVVLECCNDRNDVWGRAVSMRCHGVHDLPAAEAQYHVHCYDNFRKISPNASEQGLVIDDKPMKELVDEIYVSRRLCTWTSIELHEKYVSYGGKLTRKQMFSKLSMLLGDDAVVLSIDGCASIIGFREFVGKIVKVSKVDNEDKDTEDTLARKIIAESHDIQFNKTQYDLGNFTHTKTIEQTSATLLRFISKLVSTGEITKASLSLSQSIQQHITNARNQTTLGLGVKLHHKYGSRDLIDILYEHGYIASYDEVRRFRKSTAKYVSENALMLHQAVGFTKSVGLVFGWYDNFDLMVSTPNGRRETHAMATEFQMHPAGIIETGGSQPDISSLIIPRLTSKEAKSVGTNRSIPLLHYAGPKKVMPPAIATRTTGLSYNELCARETSLDAAHVKDADWLNSLSKGEDSIEWNGFNNHLARSQGIVKPATAYMFGPLIDAPPHHPDTILTTLKYMQGSLVDMGMTYIHLSMDMQLFEVTKKVCWHDPVQFQNVMAHPGGMHIIQSFISCIAKLMRGSALEEYVAAAYRGLTGMYQ